MVKILAGPTKNALLQSQQEGRMSLDAIQGVNFPLQNLTTKNLTFLVFLAKRGECRDPLEGEGLHKI